jgi:hypothetical protein
MDYSVYKPMFEAVCKNLELPVFKVRALAAFLSNFKPEFRERDANTWRIGILGVPENLCVHFMATPGELVIAEKNILVGCEILRAICDDSVEYSGDPGVHWSVVVSRYIGQWPGKMEWKNDVGNHLQAIRRIEDHENGRLA